MMMENGGGYEWQFDADNDDDDGGAMSMDIESFLSILDENPPDDHSSQTGLADISPSSESASHAAVDKYSQTLDDYSEPLASKTVCSNGSFDKRYTVDYGVEPLPDVYSWAPGDWGVPLPPGSRDFSSSEVPFVDDQFSMPYIPSYSSPYPVLYNNTLSFINDKIASGNTSGLPSSESSTETSVKVSTNGSHFPSILPSRRQIGSMMDETGDPTDQLFTDKSLLQPFSGVHSSVSRNDFVVKGEHDTKHSCDFVNISNIPAIPAQSFVHPIKKQQQVSAKEEIESKLPSFPNMGSFTQKVNKAAHVTFIDVDDPDICILEDMSEPAPRKSSYVDGKSPFKVTQRSSSLGAPPVHMGFNNARVKANDEQIVYRVALQDLSQPKSEAFAPDGSLQVPLLRHQRIALSWMVQKETKSIHCFGGILADDQGLGKTISTIALILKERSSSSSSVGTTEVKEIKTETFNLDDDDDDDDDDDVAGLNKSKQTLNPFLMETSRSSSKLKSNSGHAQCRPAAGTLVVCPTSVLRQWNDELYNKVSNKSRLSVLIYHGPNRTKDPSELAKYDVILTTYAIVSIELPKQPLVDEEGDETRRYNEFHPVPCGNKKNISP